MSKLEKHIKQKFQERELKPSEAAWSKIEAQLGDETAPKKSMVYWYAIAASFIGVLLLSVAYFNASSRDNQPVIEVVDTDKELSKDSESKEVPPAKIEIVEESITTPLVQKEIFKPQSSTSEVVQITENAVIQDLKEKEAFTSPKAVPTQQELIDTKLQQVLTEVASLEQQNIQVTDSEIDALLMAAQQDLLTDKAFQENGKVDAVALLADVEDELDRTFRGQLFEKLKDGFFKVRTAVADRNN